MPRRRIEPDEDRARMRAELRERLRELRRKAGLTQAQLAVLMGKPGPSGKTVVCQFEHGDTESPSLQFIADYLRACRAGFKEAADILDKYTSLPPVPERRGDLVVREAIEYLPAAVAKAVQNYDIATTMRKEPDTAKVEDVAKRLLRAERYARAALWRKKLHHEVVVTINTLKLHMEITHETILQQHARKLWGILSRTRGKPEEMRGQELAAAEEWLLRQGVVDPENTRTIGRAVVEFFVTAEKSGRLDALPLTGTSVPEPVAGPSKEERQRMKEAYDQARLRLVETIWVEVREMLEREGIPALKFPLYQGAVRQSAYIADHCAPGSEECRREVESFAGLPCHVRLGVDPAVVRRIADYAIPRYEELRQTLPPDPRGWTRQKTG